MECDKFFINTNEMRDIDTGQSMKELNKEVNYGTEKIKLVLQFPDKEQNSDLIHKEIKAILVNELQGQIKKFISYENGRSDCK